MRQSAAGMERERERERERQTDRQTYRGCIAREEH